MTDLAQKLAELRAKAEAATPGRHEARYLPGGMPTDCCKFGVVSGATGKETARVWAREDVEFYAAANPATVLALLAVVEAAQEGERRLERAAYDLWAREYLNAAALLTDIAKDLDAALSNLARTP